MATQPARQIGKAKLHALHKKAEAVQSRMGEERASLGAAFEAAATADNFNAKAYRMLRPLLKMEAGPQAHLFRTFLLYAEHFGVGTQGDLEDVIDAQKAQEGGGEDEGDADGSDGDGDGGGTDEVDSLLANMDTPALGRFRSAMAASVTVEAVNKGLERFTADCPAAADDALNIAMSRIEEINADQGGGEDLRPDTLRNAGAVEAEQAAAVGTADAKVKRTRSRPVSPAADAAKANGIGDDFGKGRAAGTPTH